MKVFVEMPKDAMSYRCFAFFDTIEDRFDSYCREHHWCCWECMKEAMEYSDVPHEDEDHDLYTRYQRLIPESYQDGSCPIHSTPTGGEP